MSRIELIPETAEVASDIHNGRRHAAWAVDFPSEGDVVIAGMICRRIAAGTDYEAPRPDRPWSFYLIAVDGYIAGGCGFKSAPDSDGIVEIGYGIVQSHQQRGIATESVRALVAIAQAAGVTTVAETEEWNIASIRVLQKVGFAQWDRPDEPHLWWRLAPTP